MKISVTESKPDKKVIVRGSKLYFGCNIWPVNRAYLALDKMCNRQHYCTSVLDGITLLATREGIKYNDKLIKWEDADKVLEVLKPHYKHRFYEEE